jgi:hypothetical protein
MSMPYVMNIHQAPVDGKAYPDYHLFVQILPPLRQPGLQKFPAGPEIGGGNFMSDTLPEEKAAELRAISKERGAVAADRGRSTLSAFFGWAVGEGVAEVNVSGAEQPALRA